MRSATVLNVAEFPKARFVSTSVRRTSTGARLAGNLTLRGVTRPFELDARIFRARGSDPEDLSELSIVLTGRMNRNNFGATGYPDLVGPNVDLRITARVIRN
jgi:polyisoprenoid-binding protein YceI